MENTNDKIALHAIIIKKPCNLEEAQEIAQDFIKDRNKKFYRETKNYYRFRNIPKTRFMPKCYKTKKINKNVSIIIGKLKPQYEHLEGSGMFDFFKKKANQAKQTVQNVASKVSNIFTPRLDSYNNTSRKTLEQYGNFPIKSLTICRTPIMKVLDKTLNFLSLGKFSELKKKYGFDELYHLQLVANVDNKNVVIEKNEVININTSFKNDSKTQTYQIPLKTMSGSGMMEKYEADMARRKEAEPERLRLEQEDRKRRDAEYDARQAEWQQTDSYKYMQRKKEEAAAEKKLWDDAGKKTKKTGGAINKTFTINEMLEKARNNVGDHLFFSYDAFKNNCQNFIKYCLEAEGLFTPQARDFLYQDIEELSKEMQQYVKTTANVLTYTGAVANKLMGKAKLEGLSPVLDVADGLINGSGKKKMDLLEIFKGTGSVGKVAKKMGYNVISIDFDPIYTPHIETDILDWDYKKFHKDNNYIPDFIWASPPCNTFSPLAYPLRERNIINANPKSERAKTGTKILHKTLEIIQYFLKLNPNLKFTIENPKGMMRSIPRKSSRDNKGSKR